MGRFSPQPQREPDTVPFHRAARMVLATVGPGKVPSPATAAHTCLKETLGLYIKTTNVSAHAHGDMGVSRCPARCGASAAPRTLPGTQFTFSTY